jgi:hypothetical protein
LQKKQVAFDPDEVEALKQTEDVLRRKLPALFCDLNVAQYRAFKNAYSVQKESKLIPALHIVSFANGVGKTTMLIFDMIGWTKGPQFLNYSTFPQEAVDYWDKLEKIRNSGQLTMRLVCSADDMKADGSVLMALKEMFPDAQVAKQDNSGVYKQIVVPHPTISGVTNVIAVHTFDQDPQKHAGSNCQRIWINENLPGNLIGETVARIRSKVGMPAGSIMQCATLLDESSWAQELGDDAAISVINSRGHIYENCVGEEVTDEMADEVRRTIGVTLEKLDTGNGYYTNGVLNKSRIETMILFWQKTCPQEVEARKCGQPITQTGKIYMNYNSAIHDVDDEHFDKLEKSHKVLMVADPHGSRPTLVGFAAIDPMDRIILFDEWPPVQGYGYYETITTRRYTPQEECAVWDEILKKWGVSRNAVVKIGDPNRFLTRDSFESPDTIADIYEKYGYKFDTDVNDDLDYGHRQVSTYLWYDQMLFNANPLEAAARVRLRFCRRCTNIRRAVANYAHKKVKRSDAPISENVNEKFKDGADIVRYLVAWLEAHGYLSINKTNDGPDEYARIRQGRIPPEYRGKTPDNPITPDMESPGRRIIVDW